MRDRVWGGGGQRHKCEQRLGEAAARVPWINTWCPRPLGSDTAQHFVVRCLTVIAASWWAAPVSHALMGGAPPLLLPFARHLTNARVEVSGGGGGGEGAAPRGRHDGSNDVS